MSSAGPTPFSSYQKKLFVFLGVATFFEGYDFIALTQVLPEIRAEMGLTKTDAGLMVSTIHVGTVVAFFLMRYADRWGRKQLLTVTIAGYTVFTFLSGLAPEVYSFALCQLIARVFLIAEWATSMVLAAEEFPADRRGLVLGSIQGMSSLGSVFCAGVVPALIKSSSYGWRMVYFVGIIPLLVLAVARRGLKESKRFAEVKKLREGKKTSLFDIWRTPYRGRMLKMSLIWGLTYVCTNNAITFWKEFVRENRGFSLEDVGSAIAIAAVGAIPLVFLAGRLLDGLGRRRGAVVIYTMAMLGVIGAYGLHGYWPLTGSLVLAIFGASACLPVLNAYTTELFPTELRGDAFAWSNNLLGRIGYVGSPAVLGLMASSMGWGPAVQLTALGPALALVLMLLWLPETKDKELEETAQLT